MEQFISVTKHSELTTTQSKKNKNIFRSPAKLAAQKHSQLIIV